MCDVGSENVGRKLSGCGRAKLTGRLNSRDVVVLSWRKRRDTVEELKNKSNREPTIPGYLIGRRPPLLGHPPSKVRHYGDCGEVLRG